VLREGDAALRAAERRLLTAALRERPAPVIALSDGALLDPRSQAEVVARARLIWLDADLQELTRRVRRERAARPGSLPAFMQKGAQVSEDALRPLLNVRRPAYATAELRVDIGDRSPTQVARQLLQLLAL
jgi:shikimate kinase